MKALVIGGSSSGKSLSAQRIARFLGNLSASPLVYFATMRAVDTEDARRIDKHIAERDGWGFCTIECPYNIISQKDNIKNSTILLDSTTALLSNEMFCEGSFNKDAGDKIAGHISSLSGCTSNMVVVGDNIFEDSGFYEHYSAAFIRDLGELHRYLAQCFDLVIEITAGLPIIHKGKEFEHYVLAALQ